jgi:mitochondrial fission protein ELM1
MCLSNATCTATKRRCGAAVFCVQVQHPRCDPKLFDLVVCPQHDFASPKAAARVATDEGGRRGVCVTRAALHRLDAAALASAREHWRRDFMLRPGPRLVACIGGGALHLESS